ncbi:amino acid ABC transporter ATP-binding protein [Vaginisenegalia massiliensis]|uniref:amino acid ABC transporter ATP-binding protein n=1 Tax=Vaginisenegalia massiliensis TaxID=2058294 RepID=UPI000F53389F|nr:amino acid ABC transporter ATP-binding protein [Vaginisenegalia massiliensis]
MLKIENWSKTFHQHTVLNQLAFQVETGQVLTIIGPSGTGKSTLLRSLNFLEPADSGHIQLDDLDYDVTRMTSHDILTLRRQTAMVFQNYGLFSRKTALENVMEALVMVKQMDKVQAQEQATLYLNQVGMGDKCHYYPKQLSGGQQQRVGIARALAIQPKLMLLDEPTSSLDPELVKGILDLIKGMAGKEMTILLATHEMSFAREISDQVLFLDQGRILDAGSPDYLFNHSPHQRIQDFLKKLNR